MAESTDQQNLLTHLNKELPNKKRTFSELHAENEEAEAEYVPMTQGTRKRIYTLWSDGKSESPEKYISLLQHIENLTEEQARVYVQCLEIDAECRVHQNLAKKIIYFLGKRILHAEDSEGLQAFHSDLKILTDVSDWTSYLLSYGGPFASVLLISLYGITSHLYYGKYFGKTTANKTECITEASVPNGIHSEEPNGKNNISGETPIVQMDS